MADIELTDLTALVAPLLTDALYVVDDPTGTAISKKTTAEGLIGGIYNVKAYGAVGNNVADDTAEIQAAIDACEASTYGGVVLLPPGTYKVSAKLTIDSSTKPVHLIGQGYPTLDAGPSTPMTSFIEIVGSNKNQIVHGIILLGNSKADQDAGIHIKSSNQITVSNVRMSQVGIGLLLENTADSPAYTEHNYFKEITVSNCDNGVVLDKNGGNDSFRGNVFDEIRVTNATDAAFVSQNTSGTGTVGLYNTRITGFTAWYSAATTPIDYARFERSNLDGFHLEGSIEITSAATIMPITIDANCTNLEGGEFEVVQTSSGSGVISDPPWSISTAAARLPRIKIWKDDVGSVYEVGGPSDIFNVKSFGALGDGVADDTAEIQAAINAADTAGGGVVYFPMGTYDISSPLVLKADVELKGEHAPRWAYAGGTPCVIKGTAGFTGAALLTVTGPLDGGRIEKISVDAGIVTPATPHGIQLSGLCRDWQLVDVNVSSARDDGIVCTGSGANWPKGLRFQRVAVYNSVDRGFSLSNTTDSILEDCLATTNTGDGFYLLDCHETTLSNCRAVFNDANGFQIAGNGSTTTSDSLGQITLDCPATDRNEDAGILIAQEGLGPVQIVAPRCRRDGSNTAGGTSSCGIKVLGTSGADDAAPVDIIGGVVTPGVDDGGGGNEGPLYGLRVTNGRRVRIHGGEYWGVTNGFAESGTNDEILATPDVRYFSGVRASQTVELHTDLVPYSAKEFAAAHTLTVDDGVVNLDTSGAQRTATLPSCASVPGKSYIIRNKSGTNNVIVASDGSDTYSDTGTATNRTLSTDGASIGLFSTGGTEWQVVGTSGTVT